MKEKRSIKHRYNGQFIAEGECESLAELASKCRADLRGADLSGAKIDGHECNGQIVTLTSNEMSLIAFVTDTGDIRIIYDFTNVTIREAFDKWQSPAVTRLLSMAALWAQDLTPIPTLPSERKRIVKPQQRLQHLREKE